MGRKRKSFSDDDCRLHKNRRAREIYAALPETKKAEIAAHKREEGRKSTVGAFAPSSNPIEDIELNAIIAQSTVQSNAFILGATASVLETHQNVD